MRIAAVVMAVVGMSGCATIGMGGGSFAKGTCEGDLVSGGYMPNDGGQRDIVALQSTCKEFTPEQIATAKKLVDDKYHWLFEKAVVFVSKTTPAQLECSKAYFNSHPPDSSYVEHREITMPEECRTAVAGESANVAAAKASNDVLAVASANPQLSTFVKMVRDAGVADVAGQAGPVILIAPVNAAFDVQNEYTKQQLATNPAALKKFVLQHIALGKIDFATVARECKGRTTNRKDVRVDSIERETWHVACPGKTQDIHIGEGKVLTQDVPADNGSVVIVGTLLKN